MRALLLVIGLAVAAFVTGATAAVDVPNPVPRPARAAAAAAAATPDNPVAADHGRVLLLRGLVNVFSLGMDKLASKLRANNLPARVTNHSHWQSFADVLIDEYRSGRPVVPIVIIGHSLGADAAVRMANYLATNGVPVRLVVAFDGVAGGGALVNGIAEVINFYKPDGYGRLVNKTDGFTGKLDNVDLSENKEIDHLNIDKSATLQDQVVARVSAIFAEK